MRKSFNYSVMAIISIVLFVNGCRTARLTDQEQQTVTYAIDFREYVGKGFLFMPDKYYGKYEVLGMIRAELHPKVTYRSGTFPSGADYVARVFYDGDVLHTQLTERVNMNQLIRHIYELSIEWGGDAFTHFESNVSFRYTDNNPNTSYSFFEISGVVIKRR